MSNMNAHNDCYWVRILYQQWFGDIRTSRQNGRKVPKNCCRMEGITCVGRHVTKIDWSSSDIAGPIPSEIGNLVNLKEL